MALTVSSYPTNNIDSDASFDVSTDIIEGGGYNNVRIRGEVWVDGRVIAIIEKPKGLDTFDFSRILKSRVIGFKKPRHLSDDIETGSVGAQLITSISLSSGTWDTFTSSGNEITAAVCSGVVSQLRSQYMTMAIGETYALVVKDLVSTGVNTPYAYLSGSYHAKVEIQKNQTILLQPYWDGINSLVIGDNNALDFSGTFELYKITTDRDTIGRPLVPYFVQFTEVYEDANGVTQTTASTFTQIYRYVPASSAINFSDYVLKNDLSKFANLNFRDAAVKYYSESDVELRLMFFSERFAMELERKLNGAGSWSGYEYIWNYEGWGVVILNNDNLVGITSQVEYRINDTENVQVVSEELLIENDVSCVSERAILECTGLTGGVEAFPFVGSLQGQLAVERTFYKKETGGRLPLKHETVGRYKLRTTFSDMYLTDFLYALLKATDVKLLRANEEPIDVAIIDDSGVMSSDELFTNEIEIEFDYGD